MAASRRKQTPAEIRAGLERARTDAAWSAARHEARRLKATGADAEARRFTEDVTDEHGRKHRKSFIGVAGERKDVFKLLLERSAIEQAGFDAIRRYEADHCRAQGEFAKGVHLVVQGEHWRDHGVQPPSGAPPDPALTQHRLQHFAKTGEWKPAWGARPTNDRQPRDAAA